MGLWWIPKLVVLEPDQCFAMLTSEKVGRVSVPGWFPIATQVNYVMDDDRVVLRIDRSSPLATALAPAIWFSVDHYDREARGGWRVVVHGALERATLDVVTDAVMPGAVARGRLRRRLRPHLVIGHVVFDPLYPSYRPEPRAGVDTDVEDVDVDVALATPLEGQSPTGGPIPVPPTVSSRPTAPARALHPSSPGGFPRRQGRTRPRGLRLIRTSDTVGGPSRR